MSDTLKTMFLILLFAGIMSLQFNMEADKTTSRQLQNVLELATHDASLALDETRLAQGEIVFDQEQAIQNIENSLKANLEVKENTSVYEWGALVEESDNSFYQSALYLYEPIFIDDDTAASSFPFTYVNTRYNIHETINGPAILLAASIKSPRYFVGEGKNIERVVIYEYFQ